MSGQSDHARAPAPARTAEGGKGDPAAGHQTLEARSGVIAEQAHRTRLNGRPAVALQRKAAENLGRRAPGPRPPNRGRAPATVQMKGWELNDDAGLEREADEMGARAVHNIVLKAPPLTIRPVSLAPIQRKPELMPDSDGDYHDPAVPGLRMTRKKGFAVNQYLTSDGINIFYIGNAYFTDQAGKTPYKFGQGGAAAASASAATGGGAGAAAARTHFIPSVAPTKIMSLSSLWGILDADSQIDLAKPADERLAEVEKDMRAGVPIHPVNILMSGTVYSLQNGRHRMQASKNLNYSQIPVLIAKSTGMESFVALRAASASTATGGGGGGGSLNPPPQMSAATMFGQSAAAGTSPNTLSNPKLAGGGAAKPAASQGGGGGGGANPVPAAAHGASGSAAPVRTQEMIDWNIRFLREINHFSPEIIAANLQVTVAYVKAVLKLK